MNNYAGLLKSATPGTATLHPHICLNAPTDIFISFFPCIEFIMGLSL